MGAQWECRKPWVSIPQLDGWETLNNTVIRVAGGELERTTFKSLSAITTHGPNFPISNMGTSPVWGQL